MQPCCPVQPWFSYATLQSHVILLSYATILSCTALLYYAINGHNHFFLNAVLQDLTTGLHGAKHGCPTQHGCIGQPCYAVLYFCLMQPCGHVFKDCMQGEELLCPLISPLSALSFTLKAPGLQIQKTMLYRLSNLTLPGKSPDFVFAKPADGQNNCMNYNMLFIHLVLVCQVSFVFICCMCLPGFYKTQFKNLSKVVQSTLYCIVLCCIVVCYVVLYCVERNRGSRATSRSPRQLETECFKKQSKGHAMSVKLNKLYQKHSLTVQFHHRDQQHLPVQLLLYSYSSTSPECLLAQWLMCWTVSREVGGSNLCQGKNLVQDFCYICTTQPTQL